MHFVAWQRHEVACKDHIFVSILGADALSKALATDMLECAGATELQKGRAVSRHRFCDSFGDPGDARTLLIVETSFLDSLQASSNVSCSSNKRGVLEYTNRGPGEHQPARLRSTAHS